MRRIDSRGNLALRYAGPLILSALALAMAALSFAGAQDLNVRIMEATFRIAGPAASSGKFAVGTVFLVGLPRPGVRDGTAAVLVTAAHVLKDISGDEAVLWLRRKTADGRFEPLEHRIKIRNRGAPLWTAHARVDVAVLPVELPANAFAPLLSADLLATDETFERFGIHPGDELLCLGFPFGLAANDAGFPILRSGKIASYPLVPAARYPAFLYDFQVYEGNSGGPVYFAASSRAGETSSQPVAFIAGLVSQYAVVEGQRLQLASVVPAQFIRETLAGLTMPAAAR
jgi:hypothetical protein